MNRKPNPGQDGKPEPRRSKLSEVDVEQLWKEYSGLAFKNELEKSLRFAFGKGNLAAQITALLQAYCQRDPKTAELFRQALAQGSQDQGFLADVDVAAESIKRTPMGERPLECALLLCKLRGKETPPYPEILRALAKANLYQTKSAKDSNAEARREETLLKRIKRALKATGTQKKPGEPGRPRK